MAPDDLTIRPYSPNDEAHVIELWQKCKLTRPWNNPGKDIVRKLKDSPELFFVGVVSGYIIAAAMAGYDGHRGSVNYLAVHPDYQREGHGRAIMRFIEDRLRAIGCPKINLQIRTDNPEAINFYQEMGYTNETAAAVSFGKRLIEDK